MTPRERFTHVLHAESEAIDHIPIGDMWPQIETVISLILACSGKIVISGMGKNGHVGKRLAATFSCTGTPALFLHPGEASHGDIGVLDHRDVILALSNSGKTRELLETVKKIRDRYQHRVPIVVFTGHGDSPLAQEATIAVSYGDIKEPCPLGLTPSSSLAVLSALLDAVALTVMEQRGFSLEDYGQRHWSGYLAKLIEEKIGQS